ncbi:MAG TPA: hypothetical protein VK941_14055 [Gillisia sp.]|nr:hypothetical protein [Gillisia sp.]
MSQSKQIENFIFGVRMNYQSCIAILFVTVFFGKFLVMDSKILVVLLDADEIVYVNPFCKKQNAKTEGNNSEKSLAEASNSLQLAVDAFCNAPFKFEVYNWDYIIISQEPRAYAYNSPSLPGSNPHSFYPPPKV